MAEGFHVAAWSQSVDTAGVLTAHAAVQDTQLRTQGNDIIVPSDFKFLWGAYAVGLNVTRAQLSSPALRRVILEEIAPLDRSTLPSAQNVIYLDDATAIPLDPAEALNALVAEDAAGAIRSTVIAFLAPGNSKPDARPNFTVRWTATTTLVAFGWSNAVITLDQSLPAGRYAVVGGRARSAGLLAWRLAFVGGIYRPGGIGAVGVIAVENPKFRDGNLGVWGEFNHNTPPTIDFLSATADTSEAGELDLVKIG